MTSGWDIRLNILRRDAENKILSKLKIHGWQSTIIEEVSKGDYIIIDAKRGVYNHKIALMYSSATDNSIYKDLDSKVEHIYINSELYKLESFAYGISVPVTIAEDFQSQLIKWNQESSEGLFSSSNDDLMDDPVELSTDSKYYRIQSENPLKSVWIHLRQLESIVLAKKNILQRAEMQNIEISSSSLSTKSEGLAFALRNASDYYKSAEGRNMSQRILNLYYGTISFAFAEMLASPTGPSTLSEIEDSTKQGHGLYTLDGKTDRLEDLIIGVLDRGFFSDYMFFLNNDSKKFPSKKIKKYEEINEENEFCISFESLISRIPDIGDLFINIFTSKPGWIVPVYDIEANSFGLRSSKKLDTSYAQLIDASGRWTKHDVLKIFAPFSDISDLKPEEGKRRFRVAIEHKGHENFWGVLNLHSSPFVNHSLIVPVFKTVNQNRAINLAILYALSIVVRYRPSLWRRVQEGDLDYMRVLIEAYLDSVERVLPQDYLSNIIGKVVIAKQPSSVF